MRSLGIVWGLLESYQYEDTQKQLRPIGMLTERRATLFGGACAFCRAMAARKTVPLLLFLFSVGVAACGSSTSTNVTSPIAPDRCQATVTASATSFGASGGTGAMTVRVSRECSWTAASGAGWIRITSATDGQGDGTVAYRVDPNANPVTRRGTLTVSGRQLELSQAAAPCRYEISAATDAVAPTGGERMVGVRTHAACSWTAVSEAPWVAITPVSGRGEAQIRLTVAPNGGAPRSATVIVAGERVTIAQLSGPAPVPLPTPSPSPSPTPTPAPAPTPTPIGEIKLDGKIQSLSGTCPAIRFRLSGRTVFTTSATDFRKGSCKDIHNETSVNVEGERMSDGTVRADRIEIKR
jgi:hypothetical protein